MPELRSCPICGTEYRRTDYEISIRRRLTCSSQLCRNKWKSVTHKNKKPIGPCTVAGCAFNGPLLLQKYCGKHYQYQWRHGHPELIHPKLEREPISAQWAIWTAGVIDCEGWVGLMKAERKSGPAYWPMIGVGNTKETLLDALIVRTGVGRKTFCKRPAPAKDMWMWTVNIREELDFLLEQVRPHLILKGRQARLLTLLPIKNARDAPRRARIQKLLKKLNKKGR